jgi:hypothetical protein
MADGQQPSGNGVMKVEKRGPPGVDRRCDEKGGPLTAFEPQPFGIDWADQSSSGRVQSLLHWPPFRHDYKTSSLSFN